MTLQNQLDYMPTLLDGVSAVPAGIDADTLRSEIMLDCGLMTPLYSEPETMKAAIAHWFAARSWTFSHLLAIVEAEYSPIENYDRNEDWTDTKKAYRDIKEELSGKDQRDVTEQLSGKDQRDFKETLSNSDTTVRSVDGDLTVEQEVSAYNSSSYVDSQKSTTTDGQEITTETTYGRVNTTDDDTTYGKKTVTDDDISYGKKTTTDDDLDQTDKHTGRVHGNVGVTTNQQMIEQELALLSSFNIYEWIAKEFAADLMLAIY